MAIPDKPCPCAPFHRSRANGAATRHRRDRRHHGTSDGSDRWRPRASGLLDADTRWAKEPIRAPHGFTASPPTTPTSLGGRADPLPSGAVTRAPSATPAQRRISRKIGCCGSAWSLSLQPVAISGKSDRPGTRQNKRPWTTSSATARLSRCTSAKRSITLLQRCTSSAKTCSSPWRIPSSRASSAPAGRPISGDTLEKSA
jgi:hypothetical protein